jgi:hypothetical protein
MVLESVILWNSRLAYKRGDDFRRNGRVPNTKVKGTAMDSIYFRQSNLFFWKSLNEQWFFMGMCSLMEIMGENILPSWKYKEHFHLFGDYYSWLVKIPRDHPTIIDYYRLIIDWSLLDHPRILFHPSLPQVTSSQQERLMPEDSRNGSTLHPRPKSDTTNQ